MRPAARSIRPTPPEATRHLRPVLTDRLGARVASHESEAVWRRDCDTLFDEFLRCFLAHEAAEHELMQDAYTQDMGAKD